MPDARGGSPPKRRGIPDIVKSRSATVRAIGDDAPVLLRIETRAGHGHGKPVAKQIEEQTDILAFLTEHLMND